VLTALVSASFGFSEAYGKGTRGDNLLARVVVNAVRVSAPPASFDTICG